MQRLLIFFLTFSLFSLTPKMASADVSGLVPCKDSPKFKSRLEQSVKKLNSRLVNYQEGTPSYLALEEQIKKTETRFDKYGKQGLLCGADGLPHLIADGRWSHAGEFILPGIGFLYTTGWIGWAGRSYLQYAKKTDKPNESEIIIDVPVALGMMASGFLWPLSATQEFLKGDFVARDTSVTISPR